MISMMIRGVVMLLACVLLVSCTDTSQNKKQPQPVQKVFYSVFPEKVEHQITRSYGDFIMPGRFPKDPPQPIPGRLLVKIAAKDIANPFKPEESDARLDWRPFVKKGILPASIGIVGAEYKGLARTGSPTFRIYLKAPQDRSSLAQAFSDSKASLLKDALPVGESVSLTSVLVEVEDWQATKPLVPQSAKEFYHLHKKSTLHGLFKSIGVQSMHRIFHSVEQEDKQRPGIFHVRKLSDWLTEIKEQNPTRTARAYPDALVPDNMENWFLLKLGTKTDLDAAIKILKLHQGIQKVSVDYPVLSAAVPDDPSFPDQWGAQNTGQSGGLFGFDISIEAAWDDATPFIGPITVAVIDTGFKEDLDELSNRLWRNPSENPAPNNTDEDGNGYVDDIHGITAYDPWQVILNDPSPGGPSMPLDPHATKVAGIIAAEANNTDAIAGVAGTADIRLMNIAIGWCSVDASFDTGSAELSEGLFYAIANNADIANMSIGMPGLPYLFYEAVETALNSGMILVASAGNDGERFTKHLGVNNFEVFPASMHGVISVGGTNRHGRRWPSSNYGPGLDLVAPADEITTISYTSLTQTDADVINDAAGTSMSAAFVSGGAAVILGKYTAIKAPYMRAWLRATARDIRDPEGVGADLVGEDQWTGSGMLDVGTATIELADIQDQPIAVDLLIERLNNTGPVRHFSYHAPDAVAGKPDLGITVGVPGHCIKPDGTNLCLNSWRLEYGIGDSPSVWFPITISDASVTSNVIDVARSGSSYYRFTEIASGHNYLNTDNLDNYTLHTIKLTAVNNAGREFTAYDYVVPMRAKLFIPHRNLSIVSRWGWDTVYGFVDIRAGANYQISFEQDDGTPLWSSSPFFPATRYDATVFDGSPIRGAWSASASAFTKLLGTYSGREYREDVTITGYNPLYPSGTQPQDYAEGWYKYTLNVQSPSGSVETDSLHVFLDNSFFPYQSPWPIDLPVHANNYSPTHTEMLVTDMGAAIGQRLFIHLSGKFLCLSPTGAVLWQKDIANFTEGYAQSPGFVVEDLDGDNVKEIVVAGINKTVVDTAITITSYDVYVFNQDGTIYNPAAPAPPQWPLTLSYPQAPAMFSSPHLSKLHVADVAGDSNKEIIFYQPPFNYYGIPEDDLLPGYLHVLDLNAQAISGVWPRGYPSSQERLLIDTGDIDADGKDEILLQPGTILEADGTVNPAWDAEDLLPPRIVRNKSFFVQMDADPELEVLQYARSSTTPGFDYTVTLRDHDNTDMDAANVWPVQLASGLTPDPTEPYSSPFDILATTAQVVAGGYEEIILCYEKITILDQNGQQVAAAPAIDLDGYCGGIDFLDVDNDGNGEIVALVHRLKTTAANYSRRGSFVEAYEVDGTRLADADNRWPLNARMIKTERQNGHTLLDDGIDWNGSITIRDIDGDGTQEAIHIRSLLYRHESTANDTRIEVLDLQ